MATKLNDVQIAQREYDEAAQAKRVTLVGSNGLTVNVGDLSFLYDTVSTFSTFDTVTPANNRALPVTLLAGQGAAPVDTNAGATTAGTLRVVLSNGQTLAVSQSGTWDINNISGTISLPTGAATETTLASVLTGINNLVGTQGQKYIAARVRNSYSGTPVTTGAWVQLIASTVSAYKEFDIFDSSGQTLELATGASGFEVPFMYIFPGGNGKVNAGILASQRLSIRAVSANATSGELLINFYS